MTITTSTNKFRYEGNGSTDTFAFTGRIFSASDLVVEIITRATDVLVETLTLTTDYNVTINGAESASVQVTNASKIPSATQDIQIRRALTQTQTLDLPTGTVFPAASVENALDKATAIVQDLSEESGRAIKLNVTSSLTDVELPAPVANELIGWNDAGDNLTTYQFADLTTSIDTTLTGLATGDNLRFDGSVWRNTKAITVNTLDAGTSAGANLRTSGGTNCLSWGGGGGANLTLGGNMSGGGSHKLVNMADGTDAQDYVTKAQLDALQLVPAGVMASFAGTTAPTGWLLCDGSAVSRTTYAALFAAIGTNWGSGDGSTTFNLPDYVTNNRFDRAAGGSLNVGDTQTDEFKNHNHTLQVRESVVSNTSTGRVMMVHDTTQGTPYSRNVTSSGGSETRPHSAVSLRIIKT